MRSESPEQSGGKARPAVRYPDISYIVRWISSLHCCSKPLRCNSFLEYRTAEIELLRLVLESRSQFSRILPRGRGVSQVLVFAQSS